MKKGIHFRNKLNRKQRRKFKKNCETFAFSMRSEYEDLGHFLLCSFIFSETPQGFDYWEKIVNNHPPAAK